MRVHRLLQLFRNFAWTALIVLFLAAYPRYINAQGYEGNGNSTYYDSVYVYVYAELSIDSNFNGDSYTEEDAGLPQTWTGNSIQLESILTENIFTVYDTISNYDPSTDQYSLSFPFRADANANYELTAEGGFCVVGYCANVINTSAAVTAPSGSSGSGGNPNNPPQTNPSCNGSPSINSNDPSGGSPGDSGTMTISGDYMTNLDGSLGSVSYWSDADGNGDPAGYIDYVTFGSTSGNSETITVPYSIDPNAPLDLGSVVVQTDCGTAYGPDFNIAPASADITGLYPSTWTADGSTFSLDVDVDGFGPSPTVSITDNGGGCVASHGPASYNDDDSSLVLNVTMASSCTTPDTATVTVTDPSNPSGALSTTATIN